MKKIFAISGSLKTRSSNQKILEFIEAAANEKATMEIYQDLAALPFFVPGLDENQVPSIVQEFLIKIEKADAFLISSPEYVFSLPGVLKNALEWTVSTTVLSGKPVGFVIAAASGDQAFESLDLILSTLVQQTIPIKRKLLIKGVSKYFDDSGKVSDEQIKEQLTALTEHLLSGLLLVKLVLP